MMKNPFKRHPTLLSTPTASTGLHYCESGPSVLARANPTALSRIRERVSVPKELFETLYGDTVYRLAAYCQALPWPGSTEPYGLLNHCLENSITALTLRQGKLLPPHAEIETMAQQEPLWTFAVFSAALLARATYLQSDKQWRLFREDGSFLRDAHPLVSGLAEPGAYYEVSDQATTLWLGPAELVAILVLQFISNKARHWLLAAPTVYLTWYDALQGEALDNCIAALIQETFSLQPMPVIATPTGQASSVGATTEALAQPFDQAQATETNISASMAERMQENTMPEVCETLSDNVANLETLLERLSELPEHNAEGGPSYLRLTQGLFIDRHTLETLTDKDPTLFPADEGVFLKDWLVKDAQGDLFHTVQPADYMDKRRFTGVIIAPDWLSLRWKEPVNKNFIPIVNL